MNREQLAELAVTLRWLQRENALQWQRYANTEHRGAAIAYGKAALAIEQMLQV